MQHIHFRGISIAFLTDSYLLELSVQLCELKNISIVDISEDGHGIGKHENLVIFVDSAIPGDRVDVSIYKKKKKFAFAKIVNFVSKSPYRTTPFCQHFGVCGGCKFQHIDYRKQLELKQKSVNDALERIGGITSPTFEPILPSKNIKYYRNKLEYTFSNRGWLTDFNKNEHVEFPQALGFHIPKQFSKILNIDECFLQKDPSNKIRNSIRNFCHKSKYTFYDVKNHKGQLRNLIIRSSSNDELMVAVVFAHIEPEKIFPFMEHIKSHFPQVTSLLYVINQKKNDTIFDQTIHTYSGRDYIYEAMPDSKDQNKSLKFKIGLKSFYQTNSEQAYNLYKIVTQFADLQGHETVYDLYTGAGTIANFIASQSKKVVGIEYIPSAIEDAKYNSELNNIKNTFFFAGDIKETLNEEFVNIHGKPDVVITDPPRAGMHKDVTQNLLRILPKKIIYVSCNPATQARDLFLLKEKYKLSKSQAVDMFPYTPHIENVILLQRN